MNTPPVVELNGIAYGWPTRPVVVVCIDGSDPAYTERGLADGILPNIARFIESGFAAIADGVVPSFTNPNNLSIVTGAPPAVHGISGNFFLDPESGAEVMMNEPEHLRADTLLAAFARAGARVVAITAKDKLRRLLAHGLDGICFSSEKADTCTEAEHGIEDVTGLVRLPRPEVYSAELSLFVLEAGIRILESRSPDIMYLSLTDYIQHAFAPGAPESDSFYGRLDDAFGRLAGLGAVVGLVADHGMSDKARADGSPNVVYLQDLLDDAFGRGATRVVLPITDPYVAHHGALGGFARVYCRGEVTPDSIIAFAQSLPGIEAALDREAVCARFALPPDREGDVAVIADAATAIGGRAGEHDLSGLAGRRLRSHGGVAEARVPFILSAPLNDAYASRARDGLRSYEIFDYAINGTALGAPPIVESDSDDRPRRSDPPGPSSLSP